MKTYLLGALFGILLLPGVTVLYGVTATTTYAELTDRLAGAPPGVVAAGVVGVLAGLMFKAGGVPAHFWVPDAAQGAGGAVAAFLTTVPKIGALVAAYRLVAVLPDTLALAAAASRVLAVASMTLGNLAAYWQTDPRRLLGWSTVSQVGYLLVPVAVAGRSDLALPSLLLYLAGYAVTNLAAFAVTTALPERRTLRSYRGLGRRPPWLGAALLVALLGLVGTPPTAVFVGKLTTTAAPGTAARLAGRARGRQHRGQPLLLPALDRASLRPPGDTRARPGRRRNTRAMVTLDGDRHRCPDSRPRHRVGCPLGLRLLVTSLLRTSYQPAIRILGPGRRRRWDGPEPLTELAVTLTLVEGGWTHARGPWAGLGGTRERGEDVGVPAAEGPVHRRRRTVDRT